MRAVFVFGSAPIVFVLLAGCGAPPAEMVREQVQGIVAGATYNFGALAHPGSCMDAQAAGTADGTQIQEWTCNGTGAQSFDLQDAGGGVYTS